MSLPSMIGGATTCMAGSIRRRRSFSRATANWSRRGEAARVSDAAVAQIMTAAIRLYVAKSDGEERTFRPIAGTQDEELTPTELLSAVSELLRALRLGPMELALWYRRRPDEEVYSYIPADRESEEIMNIPRHVRAAICGRAAASTFIPTRAISSPTPSARRAPARLRRLVDLRYRRPSRRDGVVEGDRRPTSRIRGPRQCDALPERADRRAALRPQRRSWPALSVGRRPHPASGRPAGKGRRHRRASRRDA